VVPRVEHFMHKSCKTICIPGNHIDMTKFATVTPEFTMMCDAMIRLYDGSKLSLSRRRSKLSGTGGEFGGEFRRISVMAKANSMTRWNCFNHFRLRAEFCSKINYPSKGRELQSTTVT